MRNPFKIGLIFACLLIFENGWTQNVQPDPQQLISDIIEEMSSRSDKDIDFTPIVEDLNNLLENPINLNQCSQDDLSKLAFLSDFQIQGLWDYIQTNGQILSIYELPLIPGFEKEDVDRLLPFITIAKPSEDIQIKNLIASGRHELIVKTGSVLETAKGYKSSSTTKYLGSKYSAYTRYTFQSKDKLEWGLIADKDAGEPFFKGENQKGFDYLSGYIALSNVLKLKKLVLGDFDAQFGQGLTFWSNLSAGKSSDPMGIRKRARGLVKHTSTNENTFLRGIGVTVPIKKFDVTVFASSKKIDANVEDSLINGETYFSSLSESGLHRTPTEMGSKDALYELITGGNVFYNGKKVKVGITYSNVKIDGKYIVDSTLYKLYGPSVEGRTNVGFSLEGFVKNHHIFGEAAIIPESSERAILIGGLFKLSSLIDVSILGRSYTRGYTNYYTSGFAEGSGSYNENGIFTGISIQPLKGLKFSGYLDIFSYPWLKYRVDAPSDGYEYLLQTEYRFSSSFIGQVRYRYKNSEQNYTSELNKLDYVIPFESQSARFQVVYTPSKTLMLRSRFDFTGFGNDSTSKENGYVISQDIGYTHPKYPISVSFRFAIFNTDSWNSRIYSYESDMLYTFSVPAYYSKGTRTYLLVKYSPTNKIDCWVRWSRTYFSDLKEIGSGLDMIDGNVKSDVRLMLRVRF